jgi:hypothetical protein
VFRDPQPGQGIINQIKKGEPMKTKIIIFVFAFAMGVAGVFAHPAGNGRSSAVSNLTPAGPPTFETKTSGLDIKVWVMTRAEHQKMKQEEQDEKYANMDKEKTADDQDMMMGNTEKTTKEKGTHHIRVEVSNTADGQIRNDLGAKVEVISPMKKISWVNLQNMSDHYGSDLKLKEKGGYEFNIVINDDGAPATTQFNYTVR